MEAFDLERINPSIEISKCDLDKGMGILIKEVTVECGGVAICKCLQSSDGVCQHKKHSNLWKIFVNLFEPN